MQSIELLYLLVIKELKIRYKNSFFGYIWAILNPIAFSVIYYFAFKIVMRIEMPNYSVYLLVGMFPWLWFSNSIVVATSVFRSDISIIKSTRIDRRILPLSTIFHEMIHFFFALPVLFLLLLMTDQPFFISWLWQIPFMILVQLALLFPLALALSTANILVRDVEYLIGIFVTMMFFLTPIVYPIDLVPERFQFYYQLNPLVALIEGWHDILLRGTIDIRSIGLVIVLSLFIYLLAKLFYDKTFQ